MNTLSKMTVAMFTLFTAGFAGANLTVDTVVQLHAVKSDGIDSWLERGTGQTRYDESDGLELGQAISAINYDFGNALSFHTVLNYQTGQNEGLGISQAYLKYKPLWSPKYRPDRKSVV